MNQIKEKNTNINISIFIQLCLEYYKTENTN